jgi:hypothetical protein
MLIADSRGKVFLVIVIHHVAYGHSVNSANRCENIMKLFPADYRDLCTLSHLDNMATREQGEEPLESEIDDIDEQLFAKERAREHHQKWRNEYE